VLTKVETSKSERSSFSVIFPLPPRPICNVLHVLLTGVAVHVHPLNQTCHVRPTTGNNEFEAP
jgi:hypothetical protein